MQSPYEQISFLRSTEKKKKGKIMKKRLFSIMMCLCMVLMLFSVTVFAEEPLGILKGDVNYDGVVNIHDATLLQNCLEGLENLPEEGLIVADFNGDGEVNYSDLTALQIHLGLPESNITVTDGKAAACGTVISKAAEGTRVTLTANSPSDDMEFDKWVVNEGGVTLADASSATTTFTMLEEPVSVTATYKPLPADETGSITIDGADVVCAQQDYEFTVTASDGVTLYTEFGYDTGTKGCGVELTIDEDGVGHGVVSAEWYDLNTNSFDVNAQGTDPNGNNVIETKHVEVSPEHIYVDGVCGCGAKLEYTVQYDGGAEFGLMVNFKTHGVDLTLAGETFYREGFVQTGWMGSDGEFYELGDIYSTDADVTMYAVYDRLITLTVPFTTTVTLGGDAAPGETTFDLAIVGANTGEENYADVVVSGSVTTNGAGDYDGTLTFTGPEQQLWYMLSEGAFVQQVNGGEENWTYDDTVYGLLLTQGAADATDDAASPYTVLVLPAISVDTDEGVYYDIDWDAIDWEEPQSEDMHFTNTYTKTVTEPTEPADSEPNTDATTSPQTGDNSNLALWLALLAVSAAGVIGTGVYSKRRRSAK